MNITFTKVRRIAGVVFEILLVTWLLGYAHTEASTESSKSDKAISIVALSAKAIVRQADPFKSLDKVIVKNLHRDGEGATHIVDLSINDIVAPGIQSIGTAQRNIFQVLIAANAP